MKKSTSISLGKSNFIIEEDAYNTLGKYLDDFKADLSSKDGSTSADEVMEEVEMRIADLFRENLHGSEVVDEAIVMKVIAQLGLPEGESFKKESSSADFGDRIEKAIEDVKGEKRLFRDIEHKDLGGVCSGLAHYFNCDVVLMRVLFIVAFIFAFASFWVYLICWIIVPPAKSAYEKCQMHGVPLTPDNILKYSKK